MEDVIILANVAEDQVYIPMQCLVVKGSPITVSMMDVIFEQAVLMYRDGLIAMEIRENGCSGIIETDEAINGLMDGIIFRVTLLYDDKSEKVDQVVSGGNGYTEAMFLASLEDLSDPSYVRNQPWYSSVD